MLPQAKNKRLKTPITLRHPQYYESDLHMKITQIETLCLSRMHEPERQWITHRYRVVKADCAIVVIHPDAGVTGIGEACAYGGLTRMREWVAWLAPDLIGKDPSRPEIAPHPNGRNRAYDCAVGGIDCA